MNQSSQPLQHQIAVVTGGSGVLGSALCEALAQAGARVVVLGRNLEKAQAIATALPNQAIALRCDVLDQSQLQEARAKIHAHFGQVDILVNCAGGNTSDAGTSADRTFFEIDESAVLHMINLNFLGTLRGCQVFGQDMVTRGSGSIVNIGSMAAFRPVTRGLGYGAAKAAVSQFTQWLAVYFAQEYNPNIRVNAIAPGFFLTEQNRYLLENSDGTYTSRAQSIVNHTPQKRFGVAQDLQSTLLWLVDPTSAFITGTIIPVDGGFSSFSGV